MNRTLRATLTIIFFLAFVAFTALCLFYDKGPIGPENTYVGFSSFNTLFREKFGGNDFCYKLSEYLGYGVLLVCPFFALCGLIQWIQRRNLLAVDKDLFALAGIYALTLCFYVFFEMFIVNYRPVAVEASYPSSHTVLGVVVLGTAFVETLHKVKDRLLSAVLECLALVGAALLVGARLLSGVHWLSDIIGGVLLSLFLVSLFSLSFGENE